MPKKDECTENRLRYLIIYKETPKNSKINLGLKPKRNVVYQRTKIILSENQTWTTSHRRHIMTIHLTMLGKCSLLAFSLTNNIVF